LIIKKKKRKKEKNRKNKKNKTRMKKGLPRGGMTIRVPMKLLAVASATAAYATHLLYRDRDLRALQRRSLSTITRSFGNVIRSDTT
jgi:hypothetical protein